MISSETIRTHCYSYVRLNTDTHYHSRLAPTGNICTC